MKAFLYNTSVKHFCKLNIKLVSFVLSEIALLQRKPFVFIPDINMWTRKPKGDKFYFIIYKKFFLQYCFNIGKLDKTT